MNIMRIIFFIQATKSIPASSTARKRTITAAAPEPTTALVDDQSLTLYIIYIIIGVGALQLLIFIILLIICLRKRYTH